MISDTSLAVAEAELLRMAASQPMLVASAAGEGWSKGNMTLSRAFDGYLMNRSATKSQFYDYSHEGPLGIPSLTVNAFVDYTVHPGPAASAGQGAALDVQAGRNVAHVVPQVLGLASQACLFLDLELYQKLGAWGPECKIVEFVQMPQGTLVRDDSPGASADRYYYSPRKPGADTLRFILENGAGKRVDATFKIQASRYQGGMLKS